MWFRGSVWSDSISEVLVDLAAKVHQLAAAPADGMAGLSQTFRSRESLLDENERLTQENLILAGKTQRLAALIADNARYRTLMNAASLVNEELMVTRIIAVSPDPVRHAVWLDKGARNGVREGQALLAAEGLMGQVVAVGEGNCRALLITDSAHALPVQVNRNGVRGIIEGTGELSKLTLRHLPATTDIVVGDLLVTSGLAGRFPPGYPVAEVTRVVMAPGQSFAEVDAKPLAEMDRGSYALIVATQAAVLDIEP